MSLVVIYTHEYEKLDYGEDHPFRKERFINFIKLMKNLRPETPILRPRDYPLSILELVHSKRYIEYVRNLSMKGYGMLSIDTPVFPGIFEWAVKYCWGSLTAIDLVLEKKFNVAFNPCGGLHHAKRYSDGGFCVFNDVALSAIYAKKKGKKVAIVDIDAHAGDGTMRILYDVDILKISIHEDPRYLYPGDGFIHQFGVDAGYGYTINIPLPPNSTDDILISSFTEIVIPALKKFEPTILILQSGVDGYYMDPLTHLRYTSHGYKKIASLIRSLKLPIVVLGGGGYYVERVSDLWLIILLTLIDEIDAYEDKLRHDQVQTRCEEYLCNKARSIIETIKEKHPFFM